MSASDGVKLTDSHRKPTERCMTQRGKFFMRTSQKSITEICRILICSLEARAANRSVSRGADSLLRTIEETCFLTISKSLKPSAPVTLSLKRTQPAWYIAGGMFQNHP